MSTVLVTGAAGQIGSELTPVLREHSEFGTVIATDIHDDNDLGDIYRSVDVTDRDALAQIVNEYDVDVMYHLAAILSARGEQNPDLAYDVNVTGLYNALEVSREAGLHKLIIPSSIAVFGPGTGDEPAEEAILRPTTIYGITKVLAELMGAYYHRTYGLDVRGVRFPGILSHKTKPGGGTTDYAVEAFYEAIERGAYTYFVREDTRLPMIYMPDAIKALVDLACADREQLRYHCEYNVGALSFSAAELTAAIREHYPGFEATYEPDERQQIADTWPATVDDTAARQDWDWNPEYGLDDIVEDMLTNLEKKLG